MSGTGASAMTGRYSPNATDGSPGGYSEIAQRFENLEKSVSGIASVLNSMLRAMKAEDDDDDEGGEKDKDTDEDEAEKSHKRTGDIRQPRQIGRRPRRRMASSYSIPTLADFSIAFAA